MKCIFVVFPQDFKGQRTILTTDDRIPCFVNILDSTPCKSIQLVIQNQSSENFNSFKEHSTNIFTWGLILKYLEVGFPL